MALTLTEYSFSKRKNSTATPNTAGSDATVTLKHGANIISPVFTMSSASEPVFNYCKFNNRYYFVKSKTNLRNGMWDIECIEDFLGTWKSDIGSTSAVILYASGGSGIIPDNRIMLTDEVNIDENYVAIPNIVIDDTVYKAIVGITGTGSNGVYALDNSPLLPEMLDGVDTWLPSGSTLDECLRQIAFGGGASRNFNFCIGLPLVFSNSELGGSSSNLSLGNYPCLDSNGNPITGTRITTPILKRTVNISIPWAYSDWRRMEPYTEVYLYLPFAGLMKLPANRLINDSALNVYYCICCTNGDVSISVEGTTSGITVAQANTNIAIDLPYGNSGADISKIVGGMVAGGGAYVGGMASLVASGFSMGALGAVGAGLATIASGLLNGLKGDPTGSAGLGGSATVGLDKVVHCWTASRVLTDSQANLDPLMGKPVMAKHTVGTYSGYVQTDGASVSGTMLDDEREAINQMLDRGIYYE